MIVLAVQSRYGYQNVGGYEASVRSAGTVPDERFEPDSYNP
jgi:hypothetical protein